MTENTAETPDTTETTVVDTDAAVHADADRTTEAADPGKTPNREARYRTERNDAREQVSTLTARIERLNRLDIERLASETLSAPVDFWLSGNAVSSYLDDSGNVDIHRVREDAKLLVSERPGLSKYPPAIDPSQGAGSNPGKAKATFQALLKD